MEEFIASTSNKTVRGTRVTAYFLFGFAALSTVAAIAFYFDLHRWELPIYCGVAGIGLAVAGVGYLRVSKRDTASGAT